MADEPTKLYAQFDGDEVDGTRYALGDTLKSNVDAGTREFLVGQGRFSASEPLMSNSAPPVASDKRVGDMTRQELHDTLLAGAAERLDKMPEDELRSLVERDRARSENEENDLGDDEGDSLDMGGQPGGDQSRGEGGSSETTEPDHADEAVAKSEQYAAIKDKPLGQMTTAELTLVAEVEGVDLSEATTNPKRAAAIQDQRDNRGA